MLQKVIFFLILSSISIQAQEWKQSSEKTKVDFTIKNFGVNVDGSFDEIEINTNFSKSNLSNSFINSKIKVQSIETGIKGRDKSILKEGYFFEEKFKYLELRSNKIEKDKDGYFILFANLTIKGVTKKLEIPLEVEETENTLSITANFTINRKDFDVGGGSLVLSSKVKVQVQYYGTKP